MSAIVQVEYFNVKVAGPWPVAAEQTRWQGENGKDELDNDNGDSI